MVAMGIGRVGDPSVAFKRKFRFTFFCTTPNGATVPIHFVKVAQRPTLSVDETQLDFLNARTWIPGKAFWETISVTYIDAAVTDLTPLYSWIASVYNFQQDTNLPMTEKAGWAGTGVLQMWDGCGGLIETWNLGDMWPQKANFGDLDYSDSDFVTLEITFRFFRVSHTAGCGSSFNGNCIGC